VFDLLPQLKKAPDLTGAVQGMALFWNIRRVT